MHGQQLLMRRAQRPIRLRRTRRHMVLDQLEDRCLLAGSITEFGGLTASSGVASIAAGPDGALWFTEPLKNKVGRVTTGGSFTEYAVPTASSGVASIAAG